MLPLAFAAVLSAQIVAVHDGDTFTARVGGTVESVRILGIDAPELPPRARCPEERDQAHRARAALARLLPAGGAIRLDVPKRARDRYGRLLARVLLPGGGEAGEVMIAAGLARPWRGRRSSWCPVAPFLGPH